MFRIVTGASATARLTAKRAAERRRDNTRSNAIAQAGSITFGRFIACTPNAKPLSAYHRARSRLSASARQPSRGEQRIERRLKQERLVEGKHARECRQRCRKPRGAPAEPFAAGDEDKA